MFFYNTVKTFLFSWLMIIIPAWFNWIRLRSLVRIYVLGCPLKLANLFFQITTMAGSMMIERPSLFPMGSKIDPAEYLAK